MSPHLACLVHLDLFDDASERANEAGAVLSVWVDDVVLSGPSPRRDIMARIKKNATAKGLKVHKEKRGGGTRGIELTGSFLKRRALAVANSSHLRVRDLQESLTRAIEPRERYQIFNRLISMARYQRTVLRAGSMGTQRLDARICYYKREMEKLTKVLSVTHPTTTMISIDAADDGNVF